MVPRVTNLNIHEPNIDFQQPRGNQSCLSSKIIQKSTKHNPSGRNTTLMENCRGSVAVEKTTPDLNFIVENSNRMTSASQLALTFAGGQNSNTHANRGGDHKPFSRNTSKHVKNRNTSDFTTGSPKMPQIQKQMKLSKQALNPMAKMPVAQSISRHRSPVSQQSNWGGNTSTFVKKLGGLEDGRFSMSVTSKGY